MDRVQLAALLLGIGLLVFWFMTATRTPPEPQLQTRQARGSEERPPIVTPGRVRPERVAPVRDDALERAAAPSGSVDLTRRIRSVLENDVLRIEVGDRGGRLRSIQLKKFRSQLRDDAGPVELVTVPERGTLLVFLGEGPLAGLERLPHEITRSGDREIALTVDRDGVRVERVITLDESGYGARLRVRVENHSEESVHPLFQLAWYGQERAPDSPERFHSYSLVASADGSVERSPLQPSGPMACAGGSGEPDVRELRGPVDWVGIDSQYFMAVAIPESPDQVTAYQGPIGRAAGQSVLSYRPFEVPPGGYVERNYRLYLGPKISEHVNAVDARLEPAVLVGWQFVRPLVTLFVDALVWIHDHLMANYGVAIILLTIAVRLLTFPLTQRSMKSMQRVGIVAPEMKVLQEKYKGDKPRLQQEMMALYKRKGINPLTSMGGGCGLMLVQMPFLLALYFALQSSIELRHAPFMLWITDLSAPEDFFAIAGLPIRPLPLLMGVSMVLQQRLMPTPNVDPQQRQMMMWMSVFFIFMFYSFASGLVLYWFVSNLLAIGQQILVRRKAASEQKGG